MRHCKSVSESGGLRFQFAEYRCFKLPARPTNNLRGVRAAGKKQTDAEYSPRCKEIKRPEPTTRQRVFTNSNHS